MSFHLEFECGGRLPKEGEAEGSYAEFAKEINSTQRKKDGRYRCAVVNTGGNTEQPVLPDGSHAPCFECPKKRASGRKQERCFPAEGSGRRPLDFDIVISCFPKEITT